MVFASCMPLVHGGKEAADAFQKFLRTLLPEDFRKKLYKEERKQKIRESRPNRALQELRGLGIAVPPQPRSKKSEKPPKPQRSPKPKPPPRKD